VIWQLGGYALNQLIRLASSLILTRLLAPDIYGVMSVGYMTITALTMLSDVGLMAIAIQSKDGEDPRFLNTVWMVQLLRGALITVLAAAAAGAMAYFGRDMLPAGSVYTDARVPAVILVVSLYGVVTGLESTNVYLARRHLQEATLTKIDLVCQIFIALVVIGIALFSPSVWALATGWVAGAVLKTTLTHRLLPGPRNRLEWDRAALLQILHFGKWVILSSTLSFMLTSGDRILLGFFLDAPSMGHYATAMVLFGAVQAAVLKVVGHAVLPALSEVNRSNPSLLKATLYKLRLPIDAVCLFTAGALVFLGQGIVGVLYDPRYQPAGWMLSAIGMVLMATRLDVFDQCLIAQGKTRLLSALNGLRMLVLYAAIPTGFALRGPEGAVLAVAGSAVINSLIVLSIQAHKGLLDMRRELLAVPLFAAGLAAGWLGQQALLTLRHLWQ
jgi:O-antigen/teichoic acid export membrane protein